MKDNFVLIKTLYTDILLENGNFSNNFTREHLDLFLKKFLLLGKKRRWSPIFILVSIVSDIFLKTRNFQKFWWPQKILQLFSRTEVIRRKFSLQKAQTMSNNKTIRTSKKKNIVVYKKKNICEILKFWKYWPCHGVE